MDDEEKAIADFVEVYLKRQNELIDIIVDASLIYGCGVKIVRNKSGIITSIDIDRRVPVKEIHDHWSDQVKIWRM